MFVIVKLKRIICYCFLSLFEQILPEENVRVLNYIRVSDNCLNQFKCQFTARDLLRIRSNVSALLETARFSYFEPHEGKCLSDLLGSLAKQAGAFATMMTMEGVGDGSDDQRTAIAQEVVRRIRSGLNYDQDGRVGGFSFFR